MTALIVRRLGTSEEVSRIELKHTHKRHVDRVMRGMMINMNLDEYYIDDSEVDKLHLAEQEKDDRAYAEAVYDADIPS